MKTNPLRLAVAIAGLAYSFITPKSDGAAPTHLVINVEGLERHAMVFAPDNLSGGKVPLVLAFHGHGGNPPGFAQVAQLQNAWPEALVVYPRGIPIATDVDPEGTKPGWQRRPGEVNDRDLKFVEALLAKLREQYPVDDQRIYVVGFSNGAFLPTCSGRNVDNCSLASRRWRGGAIYPANSPCRNQRCRLAVEPTRSSSSPMCKKR